MRPWTLPLAITAIVIPFSASALWSTAWDLRMVADGTWSASPGVATQFTLQGLAISATHDGFIRREDVAFTHRIDAVTVTAIAAAPTPVKLLWHSRDIDPGSMVELPFTVPGTGMAEPVQLELSRYPEWDPATNAIAIAVPAGSQIILQSLQFRGWNILERFEEAVLSLGVFDTFRAYSINFLWGPLMTFTPIGRAGIFDTLPPFARSVNWVVYAVLGVLSVIIIGTSIFGASAERRRRAILAFVCAFSGLWILYDLRMSAEILSYAKDDVQRWVLPAQGKKTFRMLGDFWDFLAAARPFVAGQKEMVFVGMEGAPLMSLARYDAYPAAVLSPDAPRGKGATWVLYRRPDLGVTAEKRVARSDGTILSGTGEILLLHPNGIVFREHP